MVAPQQAQYATTQQPTPYSRQVRTPMLGDVDQLRYLTERPDIPEDVKKRFWIWTSPEVILSNLDVAMVNQIRRGLKLSILLFLNDCGDNVDYKVLQWLNDLEVSVILALMRSTGGPERERKLIATGYLESSSTYQEQVGQRKTGWFGRK